MKSLSLLLLYFAFTFPEFALGQDITVSEKHTLRIETGLGFADVWGRKPTPHPHSSKIDAFQFKSWTNFQGNISYAFKADFIEFEVKLGCNHSSYYYSYVGYGGVANFTTTVASGTIVNNRFFVQPIGFNFGKERSWGNLFGGAYVRMNFRSSSSTNGLSKTDGQRWQGGTMVPVNTTNELSPFVDFGAYSFGLQAGANIKFRENSFVRLRVEVNPHYSNSYAPVYYYQLLFNVGYSYVFKRSTRKLTNKNDF